MKKTKGFTLIELLVVISIIALLLSIMMPSLTRARQQARAVVCQSNLKQIYTMFTMYTLDNNNRLHHGWGAPAVDRRDRLWIGVLEPYYGDGQVLICPETTRSMNDPVTGVSIGTNPTREYWGPYLENRGWAHPGDKGSYGINGYTSNPPGGVTSVALQPVSRMWRTLDVRGAANVPLLLDSWWMIVFPQSTDSPPQYEGHGRAGMSQDDMRLFVLNRHGGGINGSFFDGSVRKVGLKELWTLKWHREYNTNHWWTKAGGVQPGDWPEWMRRFSDF